MTPFLGLLLILLFAFVGTRFFSRSTLVKTPLFSGLLVSGIPYILIGLLLGPNFFNFLNREIILELNPLISLAIGWIGLLFGLQLRWRNLKRFPGNYILFSSLQSWVSFGIIFLLMGAISFWAGRVGTLNQHFEAALVLAAIGCISSPLSIAKIVIENRAKGRLTHLVQFVSSLDSFWGIAIAGLVMTFFHPPAIRWFHSQWPWLFITPAIGVLLGILFHILIRIKFQMEELLLLVLGLVIFSSGIGFYLQLSPIFITMVVGITLAQFHREADRVMRILHLAEKPIYLFLLIFAGALWNFHFFEELLLIAVFLLAHFAGKYSGGWISAKKINCSFPIPGDVGKTLLSFGGISLAIAFNYQLFYGGTIGDFMMSATILGIFIFDEYTAVSALGVLRRAGEVK